MATKAVKKEQVENRKGRWFRSGAAGEVNGIEGLIFKGARGITLCTGSKVVELKGNPNVRRTKTKRSTLALSILNGFASGAIGKDGKGGLAERKVLAHAVNHLAMLICSNADEKHRAMAHLVNVCAWAISAEDYLEKFRVSDGARQADQLKLQYATERQGRRTALAMEIVKACAEHLPGVAAALGLAIQSLGNRQLLRDAAKILVVEVEPKPHDSELTIDPALPASLVEEVICDAESVIIPGSGEYTLRNKGGMSVTICQQDDGMVDTDSCDMVTLIPFADLTVDEHLRRLAAMLGKRGGTNHDLLVNMTAISEEQDKLETEAQIACVLTVAAREEVRASGIHLGLSEDLLAHYKRYVHLAQEWRLAGCMEWQQAQTGVQPMQFVIGDCAPPSIEDLIFGALATKSRGSARAIAEAQAFEQSGVENRPALTPRVTGSDTCGMAEYTYPGSPNYRPFGVAVNGMIADVAAKNHAAVHDFLCKIPGFESAADAPDGKETIRLGGSQTDYCAKLDGELHLTCINALPHKPGASISHIHLMRQEDGNFRLIYIERHMGVILHRDDASITSCSILFGGLVKKRLITIGGLPLDRTLEVSSPAQLDRIKAMIEDPERIAPILVFGSRAAAKEFMEHGSEGCLVAVIDTRMDVSQINLEWQRSEGGFVIYPLGKVKPVYASSYPEMMWARAMGAEVIAKRVASIIPLATKVQQHQAMLVKSAADREAALMAELQQALSSRNDPVDAASAAVDAQYNQAIARLEDQNRAADIEIQRLRSEVDELRRKLREEQQRREGVLATFVGTELGEQALQVFNTDTFDDLPALADTIASRVAVTPRAVKEAQGIKGYMNCPQVYRILQAMHDHLWPSKFAGDAEGMGRWVGFLKSEGLDFAKCGDVARSHSLGGYYQVTHEGDRLELDMHIRGHSGRDIRRQLRIYYTWHEKTRQLVVGSMPAHLPIQSS